VTPNQLTYTSFLLSVVAGIVYAFGNRPSSSPGMPGHAVGHLDNADGMLPGQEHDQPVRRVPRPLLRPDSGFIVLTGRPLSGSTGHRRSAGPHCSLLTIGLYLLGGPLLLSTTSTRGLRLSAKGPKPRTSPSSPSSSASSSAAARDPDRGFPVRGPGDDHQGDPVHEEGQGPGGGPVGLRDFADLFRRGG